MKAPRKTSLFAIICSLGFLLLAVLNELTDARSYEECRGQPSAEFITNPNTNCEYTWIYCDGDDSMLCSDLACDPEFECPNILPTTSSSTSSSTTTSTTTTTTLATPTAAPSTLSTQSTTKTTASQDTPRLKCRKGVYEIFSYPFNPSYYYQCVDGYLLMQQCPFGFKFNETQRFCTSSH